MNVNNRTTGQQLTPYAAEAVPQSNSVAGKENMFMRLMLEQMTHQDPSNPTDSNQMANQFAQMAQTESLTTVAKLMNANNTLMDNLQTLSTANLVGKQVMVQSDSVDLKNQPIEARITLKNPASVVTLHLKDKQGTDHTISLGKLPVGQNGFSLDPQKNGLPAGEYTLSIVTDTGEKSPTIELAGTVNTVRISPADGQILLDINGLGDVPYNQITQFGPAHSKPAHSF
ncbi:flagellar hook capping FlgD N-terminal domain-containing protein [Rouxiella sp. WC2420]|uniref:Basal-body rod modification protein FlgD n=1 Tax=Rouxiella sp. WC2420 TaxID=3234145 RepID=A0AB39VQ52_9GAMM